MTPDETFIIVASKTILTKCLFKEWPSGKHQGSTSCSSVHPRDIACMVKSAMRCGSLVEMQVQTRNRNSIGSIFHLKTIPIIWKTYVDALRVFTIRSRCLKSFPSTWDTSYKHRGWGAITPRRQLLQRSWKSNVNKGNSSLDPEHQFHARPSLILYTHLSIAEGSIKQTPSQFTRPYPWHTKQWYAG